MRGKKICVAVVTMSLALAVVLGGVSINSNVNSKADVLYEDIGIDVRKEKAEELLSEMTNAVMNDDKGRCDELEDELYQLGYREATEDEVEKLREDKKNTSNDELETGVVEYVLDEGNFKTYVTEYTKTYKKKKYKIKEFLDVPKTNKHSDLYHTEVDGITKVNKKQNVVEKMKALQIVAEAYVSNKYSIVGEVITAFSVLNQAHAQVPTKTTIKNIKAAYMYNVGERLNTIYVNNELYGVYNEVHVDVTVYVPNCSVKGKKIKVNSTTYNYNDVIKCKNYGNVNKVIDVYRKTKGSKVYGHDIYDDTVIRDIRIKGLEGQHVKTITTEGNWYCK